MRRVVVLGGLGLFGRTAVKQLRRLGIAAKTASRSAAADLRIDANDAASLRAGLRAVDVIIDTAGPFYERSPALLEAAIELGCDVIDINDDLGYAERVLAMQNGIDAAGIRVLSSASTASAVAAATVRHAAMAPQRVTAFLAPATRHTANAGSARSLIRSVGQPVRVWGNGRLHDVPGWSEARRFMMPPPLGPICGRLFESADALFLPRIWPTIRDVSMYVDPNTPGVSMLLRLAARSPTVRRALESQTELATWFARRLGSSAGGIGYEIESADGHVARYALIAAENSFIAAVAPAILAARVIVQERFPHRGFVLPDRHVEPVELFEFLESSGIKLVDLG